MERLRETLLSITIDIIKTSKALVLQFKDIDPISKVVDVFSLTKEMSLPLTPAVGAASIKLENDGRLLEIILRYSAARLGSTQIAGRMMNKKLHLAKKVGDIYVQRQSFRGSPHYATMMDILHDLFSSTTICKPH